MKRAIALCGGGTKGAYELGAWKALRELGIPYQIVTGTSIGAINGALMAAGDFEQACELWDTIEMENVMADGLNLTTTIEGMYNQREAIRPFLKKYVKNKGADISPFIEFIDRTVDEERVRASGRDYGLVTVQVTPIKPLELTLNEIPQGKLKDFIMASASVFPVFPMQKIDGVTYLDGCYYDNLPVDLALKMGAEEVIAVDLHTSPSHPNYVNKPYVTYITPSRPLGTILNFDRKVLDDNVRLGYYDTMKAFGRMAGKSCCFYTEELGDWNKAIWNYSARVAAAEACLTEGTFKRFVKPGSGRHLCGAIEEHIGRKTGCYTREDYFLGGAEICGEIFQIPEENPWGLKAFIREIQGKIKEPEFYTDRDSFGKKPGNERISDRNVAKSRADRSFLTGCIYYGYKQRMPGLEEQLNLLMFHPGELAAALFLLAVEETDNPV